MARRAAWWALRTPRSQKRDLVHPPKNFVDFCLVAANGELGRLLRASARGFAPRFCSTVRFVLRTNYAGLREHLRWIRQSLALCANLVPHLKSQMWNIRKQLPVDLSYWVVQTKCLQLEPERSVVLFSAFAISAKFCNDGLTPTSRITGQPLICERRRTSRH